MNLKNILLVIAIIFVVAFAFAFLISHQAHPKEDSRLEMTSEANLTEGDNVTFRLSDANGTPIAGHVLNITIFDSSGRFDQQILTTDSNGQVSFELSNKTLGNCVIKVKFPGNDVFNGCNLTENIIINQKIIPIIINSTSLFANNTTTTYTQPTTYDYNYYESDDVITVEDY